MAALRLVLLADSHCSGRTVPIRRLRADKLARNAWSVLAGERKYETSRAA